MAMGWSTSSHCPATELGTEAYWAVSHGCRRALAQRDFRAPSTKPLYNVVLSLQAQPGRPTETFTTSFFVLVALGAFNFWCRTLKSPLSRPQSPLQCPQGPRPRLRPETTAWLNLQ